jgi:hypothetical protein
LLEFLFFASVKSQWQHYKYYEKNNVSKDWKEKRKNSQDYSFRFFKHPVFLYISFLGAAVFFLPLFLLAFLILPSYVAEKKMFISLLILSFLFVIVCTHFYVLWRVNSYLITREGLFVFRLKDIFFLETEMIPIEKMSTFDMNKKGFWGTVLEYGDIILASLITDNIGTATIFIKNISHPKKVLNEIRRVSKNYSNPLLKILENDVIDTA